jgi:hypothetical protein
MGAYGGVAFDELAVRAHDIVVCMERKRAGEFDALATLGTAVRLALHLRGAPPMAYDLLKEVAIHVLSFSPAEVRPAVDLLAEAEFVTLVTVGKTAKTVIPFVPYFDEMYTALGEVGEQQGLNELEQLTIALAHKLAASPVAREHAFSLGAEKKLVERTLGIAQDVGFVISRRARGRDVLLSPSYFPDNPDAFADLIASKGTTLVGRVLDLLRRNQGVPLSIIEKTRSLGGEPLSDVDVSIIRALGRGGFAAPPAIETKHAGTNFFIFGPRPGASRLPLTKRNIYERAMALVAAVRQGQFLPAQFKIRSPIAILMKLKNAGYVGANSEAWEQYRQVATMGIARIERGSGDRGRLVLIDAPENHEALDMAIALVSDGEMPSAIDDSAIIAFREGHAYVESLVGRKRLVDQPVIALDSEARAELDAALLTRIR